MRIIAGHLKGRRLERPVHAHTRPTSDRVREAVFSMVSSRIGAWQECVVLDAFAGSGALGIEALSRGALSCVFFESHPQTLPILKQNIHTLKLMDHSTIMFSDFFKSTYKIENPFNLVFLDPPYHKNMIFQSVVFMHQQTLLVDKAYVVLEMGENEEFELLPFFTLETCRVYGTVKIMIVQYHKYT